MGTVTITKLSSGHTQCCPCVQLCATGVELEPLRPSTHWTGTTGTPTATPEAAWPEPATASILPPVTLPVCLPGIVASAGLV